MKKKPTAFYIVCAMGLFLVAAIALMFPGALREHAAAFILAGLLIVISSVAMWLLTVHHREQAQLRQAEHELEKSRLDTQIELALRGIGGGFTITKFDKVRTIVYVSEPLAALLGYTVEEFLEASGNRLTGLVPEEDHPVFAQNLDDDEANTLRFHMRCKDGSLKWISSRGKIVVNEKGERERYSFNHDITLLEESRKEQERIAAKLRRERQMYRNALLHDCDFAYIVNVDENRFYDVYKGGTLARYGFDPTAPYDETMDRVIKNMKPVMLHGSPEYHLTSQYIEAYERGRRIVDAEYYVPGEDVYKRNSIFLSKDENGTMYVFVVAHDITAEQREELETARSLTQLAEAAKEVGTGNLNVEIDTNAPGLVGVLAEVLKQTILQLKWSMDRLSMQATQDAMTGVKNKRAWQNVRKRLDEELAAGTANFAIVVCDVNGLKHINDTAGHGAGDDLIIRACRLICNTFKHSPVYRVGGDEFVVLLERSDLQNQEALLREFYAGMEAAGGPDGPVISVALGLAHCEPGDISAADVFHRADEAMYQNKAEMKENA